MNFATLILTARMFMDAAATIDGAAEGEAVTGCGAEMWTMLIMYGAIGLIFYFLLYRPQKKKRQQDEAMRSSVEVGDEVITIGGICGRVVSVKEDDIIVIETGADRTKIKMKNWSISSNETARARQAEIEANAPKKPGLFGKKDSSAK